MRYYPVFMDLKEQPVLVAGGGNVAERKIRLLRKAGAQVRVVARELNETVWQWFSNGDIEWVAEEYRHELLDGARLAFAATNDPQLNTSVFREAEARGIPANVVDDRAHCRFISPAVVDRDPLQVAISSGGRSPVMARRLRGWIEQLLPLGIGKVASAAGALRPSAARLPLAQRRRFWERVLTRSRIFTWSNMPNERISAAMARSLEAEAAAEPGRVILVGAGPGRADLLTLRALQALGEADVILHDRLVSADILDLARRDAEFIDVGKRAGNHHETQRNIEHLLVEHAARGNVVVRLKGGDPFVFGRGGEELEHLRAHGIEYEVVPGVTAATACAAFAGIPLTHRAHSQALTLITGHIQADGKQPAWKELAGPGRTLAVYMGVKQAARLKERLLGADLSHALPVALIADGTRESQQVIHGTVDELPSMAARVRNGAPGLFIIGDVSALGEQLSWFEPAEQVRAAA